MTASLIEVLSVPVPRYVEARPVVRSIASRFDSCPNNGTARVIAGVGKWEADR